MALSNLKKLEPEKADPYCSDADNGAGEEEKDQEEEEDIVDWKDFGGLDEYPVDGIEDVDMTKNVSTTTLAD